MKHTITISILLFLTLASCDNTLDKRSNKQETPKALQADSYSSIETYSKRGDDLVEILYRELVGKTPELKTLESEIKSVRESQSDSMELFGTYNGKNQSYYTSANNHVAQIQDSILREKIKSIISNSLIKYNSQVSTHSNIIDNINKKNISLNDLHYVLKVTRTLPLIEKYQSDNIPSTKPLAGFERELDKTLKHADSLANK